MISGVGCSWSISSRKSCRVYCCIRIRGRQQNETKKSFSNTKQVMLQGGERERDVSVIAFTYIHTCIQGRQIGMLQMSAGTDLVQKLIWCKQRIYLLAFANSFPCPLNQLSACLSCHFKKHHKKNTNTNDMVTLRTNEKETTKDCMQVHQHMHAFYLSVFSPRACFLPWLYRYLLLCILFQISKKPVSLSHTEATSIPYVAVTSWAALCTVGELREKNTARKR